MFKHYCLILLLLCFSERLASQQFVVDTLLLMLEDTSSDLEKVDIYLGLSRAYNFNGDNENMAEALERAIELSGEIGYRKGAGMAAIFKANLEYFTGKEPEVVFETGSEVAEIAREISSKSLEAFANYHIAEYFIYDKNNYIKGTNILTEAIANLDETVSDKHKGNIYKVLAAAYEIQGKDSLAIHCFNKAIYHFRRVGTDPFILPELGRQSTMEIDGGLMNQGQVLIYLARIYRERGDYTEAAAKINNAANIYRKTNSHSHLAWAEEELGDLFSTKGNYEKAIENYQKALLTYEKLGLNREIFSVKCLIGKLFYNLKEYDIASEYYTSLFEDAQSNKDTVALVDAYGFFGMVALSKSKYNSALDNFLKAEELNQTLQDSSQMARINAQLGKVYFGKKNYEKSLSYFNQALGLGIYFDNEEEVIDIQILIAQVFLEQNETDKALAKALEAKRLLEDINLGESEALLEKTFSQILEKQNKFEAALVHYKNYVKLHDQLYTDNAQTKLKEEQVRQNVVTFQKEKTLAEREANLLAGRNKLYLGLAATLVFILGIGTYFYFQLKQIKERLSTQNLQLQQLNTTKDKFFGIIAHDIRSPIAALDGVGDQMNYYLKKEDKGKLERLAGRVDVTAKRLSSLLDNLLNWALLQQGVIPYHPRPIKVRELASQTMEMFENNAESKSIACNINIDKDLEVFGDESAMSTILRNLVSNAIKFTPHGGSVSISTEVKQDKVFIKINDTGTGISAEKISKLFTLDKKSERGTAGEKGTGLGLTLVKELAELNRGSIQVTSHKDKGSSFIIALPLAS